MKNPEETRDLISLMSRLSGEDAMIGWLCTVHWNRVHYENNPVATKEVQQQLNRAAGLMVLAYIWALLEEHGFDENNRLVNEQTKLELKAWKHIRHTGAHAPGGRARRYYEEFNMFMHSPGSDQSGLKANCKFTENSISLKEGMSYMFFQFVQMIVQQAVANCASNTILK